MVTRVGGLEGIVLPVPNPLLMEYLGDTPDGDLVAIDELGDAGHPGTLWAPANWPAIDVHVVWGLTGAPGTPGDIVFRCTAGMFADGDPLDSATERDRVTVAEADLDVGTLHVTEVAAGIVLPDDASLVSLTVSRCRTDAADTIVAPAGMLAAIVVHPNYTG